MRVDKTTVLKRSCFIRENDGDDTVTFRGGGEVLGELCFPKFTLYDSRPSDSVTDSLRYAACSFCLRVRRLDMAHSIDSHSFFCKANEEVVLSPH